MEKSGIGERMDIIKIDNCGTCENNIPMRTHKWNGRVCEVFNLPLDMYLQSTMQYGCNSYIKDVNKVQTLPTETKINGRDYILWDRQHSKSNAELSAEIVSGRVPKSDPHVVMATLEDNYQMWGVYVKKEMFNDE